MSETKEVQKLKDLLRIIEKCRANGVKMLKYEGIVVVFDEQTTAQPKTLTARQTKAAEKNTQEIETEAIQGASRELDEEELATLSVENPAAFEQLLVERELTDERSEESRRQDA